MTTITPTMPSTRWELISSDKGCDFRSSSESYLAGRSRKQPSLSLCQESCEALPNCVSITYYTNGWCSQFSTSCSNLKAEPAGAETYRKSGTSSTTATTTTVMTTPTSKKQWELISSDKGCDFRSSSSESYLAGTSRKQPSLSLCQDSCEASANCVSITYYANGFCSQFSTSCSNLKAEPAGAETYRLKP